MTAPRRALRLPQVEEKTGLRETQIRDAERRGVFPKSFAILPGGRARAWDEAEIDAYLASRMAGRDAPEPTPKARKRRAEAEITT